MPFLTSYVTIRKLFMQFDNRNTILSANVNEIINTIWLSLMARNAIKIASKMYYVYSRTLFKCFFRMHRVFWEYFVLPDKKALCMCVVLFLLHFKLDIDTKTHIKAIFKQNAKKTKRKNDGNDCIFQFFFCFFFVNTDTHVQRKRFC